jgi:hypothetical protein
MATPSFSKFTRESSVGKYVATETRLNELFGSSPWLAEGVPAFPANFEPEDGFPSKYCQFSVVASEDGIPGYARFDNVSGVIMIEIYTPAGSGPRDASEIADKLDKHLQAKTFGETQFFKSSCGAVRRDVANPTLSRAIYQVPFTHSGVP